MFRCPLCGSNRCVEVSRVGVRSLVGGYARQYRVDVARFFPESDVLTLQCSECHLRTHTPASPGDGRFYDEMRRHAFYYEANKPEFAFALECILERRPASVLELGCGDGLFLRKLKSITDVYGTDLGSDAQAEMARAGISSDKAGMKHGFVMAFQVLEHVADVRHFLSSAVDKLEPDGQLLLTVPNSDSRYLQEGFSLLDYPPHHLTQWSRRALESVADILGLRVLKYYLEPIRIEHYVGLIRSRRRRILGKGVASRLAGRFGGLLDRTLAPYFFDQVDYPGHTHGVLLARAAN